MEHDENPQAWWAVGRLGARVPLYGSAHDVVPPHVVHEWLERCLSVEWKSDATQAPMAAALMARRSGDRVRDVSDALREQVASRLEQEGKSEAWVRMVREVAQLEERLAAFVGPGVTAVSCSSGTDALLLGLMARGVGPGDAVFLPGGHGTMFDFPHNPDIQRIVRARCRACRQ